MTKGPALRIPDSFDSRKISLAEDCVRCSRDEKGHSESDKGAQVPQ